MTWWVINCPSAAQDPAPRSLFLLYDKKEGKSSEAVCINNRRKISHCRSDPPASSLQTPRRPRHGLNSLDTSELPFSNPCGVRTGVFQEEFLSHSLPQTREICYGQFVPSEAWSRKPL